MKERSIYNLVFAIIAIVAIIPLFILNIIFTNNPLNIIFSSIYTAFAITHYILKGICYAKEESTSKEVLDRLSNAIFDVVTTLIIINYSLYLEGPIKWILMAMLIVIGIIEILIDSINKVLELKYVLAAAKAFTMIFITLAIYTMNIPTILGILSVVSIYMFHLLGKLLNNKYLCSFDLLSIVLFGIFSILN